MFLHRVLAARYPRPPTALPRLATPNVPRRLATLGVLPALVLVHALSACDAPASSAPRGAELGKSPALLAAEGEPPVRAPSAAGKPPIYDEQADHHAALERALAQARREHKHVLITFGGNWCGWCHVLHELFEAPGPVRERLQHSYVQLRVDSRTGRSLATRLGANLPSVPFLTVLDAQGNALLHQETGALERGPAHDPDKVLALLERHAPKR